MSMNGIDISSWQRGIDLAAVPCEFVVVKATEGTSYLNPYCGENLRQAEGQGKKLGVYHFAGGGNPNAEAEYFVENVKNCIGKAILVLDWEIQNASNGTEWAKSWLDRVYALTRVKPLIYMSNHLVNSLNWSEVAAAGYRLWNAYYFNYGTPMGYRPDAPLPERLGAWGTAVLYQYTSEGNLEGYSGYLDLDVFYGTPGDWDAYARIEDGSQPNPAPAPEPQPDPVITYKIRRGDTLSQIARRYGTTVAALAQLNGISNPNRIYAGQVLQIPSGSSGGGQPTYYVVKWGDTLSGIANRFGTTYQRLMQLNGISNPNRIFAGQRLRIY
ncbi:MAG: LysM peptidoglycan-binding domain-containing protein [Dorea sp.]|nr:LysM peptidoglycan-binding domain-containing protein [Dorea sp.]